MKLTTEAMSEQDSQAMLALLAGTAFHNVLKLVANKRDVQLALAAEAQELSGTFPPRAEEAEKCFSKALRYRHFVEVANELVNFQGSKFEIEKMAPTDPKTITDTTPL